MNKRMSATEKVLAMYNILKYHTQDEAMSHSELLEALEDEGIETSLRSIADYCSILKDADLIRQKEQKETPVANRGVYGLFKDHYFDLWEVKILLDAVAQIPNLPKKTVEEIQEKLLTLSSPSIHEQARRVRTDLPDDFYDSSSSFIDSIQTILTAIIERKILRFHYVKLGKDKRVMPDEKPPRSVHPYALTIRDQHFYLIGYHEEREKITPLRIDRIVDPVITDKRATPMSRLPIGDMTSKVHGFVRNHTNNFFYESTLYLTIRWHPEETPVHVLFDVMGEKNVSAISEDYVYQIKTTDNLGLIANLLRLGPAVEILKTPANETVLQEYLKQISTIASYYPDQFTK